MVSIRLLCATLFAISLAAVSGLPIMSSGGSGSEQPHILARAFSCEEPEPTREDNIQNLGSLETGLTVLRRNASKLSRDWPFTPSEACSPRPVNHHYGTDAVSLSSLVVNVQDLANWMGVFEAYGEVIRQIIARDIPVEQAQQLESLYDIVSAVLIDYKNLLQPLHCDCETDCFEVPSVQSNIPEDCPSLAELVVSDLNTRDLIDAQNVRSYWLVKQAFADESGVTNYFSEYLAVKPSEEQWTADHSLSFSWQ